MCVCLFVWMCLCIHLLRNQGEWLSSIHSGREQQRELLEKQHESHSASSTAEARRVWWQIQSQKNNVKEKFIPDGLTQFLDPRTCNDSCLTTSHGKPMKDKGSCCRICGNWCLPRDGSWSPPPLCRLQWDGAGMYACILDFYRCFFCWWDSCCGWYWSSWGTLWEMELCSPAALSESRTLGTAGASGSENENTVENYGFLMLQADKFLGKTISEILTRSGTMQWAENSLNNNKRL